MGRKNKNKTNRRAASAPSATNFNVVRDNTAVLDGDGLAFIQKDMRGQMTKPNSERALFPNKPNMTLDPHRMRRKLLALPPNMRSATAERLIQAYGMMDDIEKLQKERGDRYDDDHVDIDILKDDPSYIKECALLIKSYVSSDFRVSTICYMS